MSATTEKMGHEELYGLKVTKHEAGLLFASIGLAAAKGGTPADFRQEAAILMGKLQGITPVDEEEKENYKTEHKDTRDAQECQIHHVFNIKQYIKIKPLDGIKGRVTSIIYDGQDIMYKVEYYADCNQCQIIVFEDELETHRN